MYNSKHAQTAYGLVLDGNNLPKASGPVEITAIDKIGRVQSRICVIINGKVFRRLQDRNYPVVWCEGVFGNVLSNDENYEIEGIFKDYCESLFANLAATTPVIGNADNGPSSTTADR